MVAILNFNYFYYRRSILIYVSCVERTGKSFAIIFMPGRVIMRNSATPCGSLDSPLFVSGSLIQAFTVRLLRVVTMKAHPARFTWFDTPCEFAKSEKTMAARAAMKASRRGSCSDAFRRGGYCVDPLLPAMLDERIRAGSNSGLHTFVGGSVVP